LNFNLEKISLSARSRLARLRPNPFCLPKNYKINSKPIYFIDNLDDKNAGIFQPDIYELASRVAGHLGCAKIVDIGCGNGDKLCALGENFDRIGIDYMQNFSIAQKNHPQLKFFNVDLTKSFSEILELAENSIVICSDVIEHLPNPLFLLKGLNALRGKSYGIIISTPDRDVARGLNNFGPPDNLSHTMEWNKVELNKLLSRYGLVPESHQLTRTNNISNELGCQTIFIKGSKIQYSTIPKNIFEFTY
jgi:2-polyprenyl-3-methyl-5-hydroxy-6-metoxy-1,4-benzoquinol methylase